MIPEPDYFIKLSIGLALVALFYQVVLRRHTFYTWNRWYLLVYSALSFFIPLIDLSHEVPPAVWTQSTLIQSIPRVPELPNSAPIYYEPNGTTHIPLQAEDYILIIIAIGCLVMAVRFALPWIAYLRIKRKATLVEVDYDVRIFHSQKDIVPFSFGKNIFFNPNAHTSEELRDIVLHELVHVRQKHTLDVLFAELLCILNWYNPFAWMIRHAIRQNLEFIADREVIEQGVDAREYQYLLLKVVGYTDFRVASPFNLSPLKQRILMMNSSKSARIQLARFLFVLPLLVVVLISFSSSTSLIESAVLNKWNRNKGWTFKYNKEKKVIYFAGILMDAHTGRPIANLPLVLTKQNDSFNKYPQEKTTPDEIIHFTTDENGYFFWAYDTHHLPDTTLSFFLKSDSEVYADFSSSMLFRTGVINADFLEIVYLKKKGDADTKPDWYRTQEDYLPSQNRVAAKEEIKRYLLSKLPAFASEHEMKVAFRKRHKNPKEAITKFRNAYFNDDGDLLGYDSITEFFVDNEKVSYREVNRAFEDKTTARLNAGKIQNPGALSNRYNFYTFTPYKDKPHPSMVKKEDVEWVDVENFDLNILKEEPYMLDGFRQTYGMGSNLMPLKEEIKRVAILKNDLAHYYDKKLKKLWWIETRPAEEVQGRPDFARVEMN